MVLMVFYFIPDKYRLIVRFKQTKIKERKTMDHSYSKEQLKKIIDLKDDES